VHGVYVWHEMIGVTWSYCKVITIHVHLIPSYMTISNLVLRCMQINVSYNNQYHGYDVQGVSATADAK